MGNSHLPANLVSWDQLDVKVRLGSLLFDILLDDNIYPMVITSNRKHSHGAIEVQFIDSGQGFLLLEDRRELLEQGSVHLIGQHVFHSFKPHPAQPGERSTLRFTFRETHYDGSKLSRAESDQIQSLFSHLKYCQLTDKNQNRELFRLVSQIRTEIEHPTIGSYSKILSLFAQFIIDLVRGMIQELGANMSYAPIPNKDKNEQWSLLIDNFFTLYQQPLTLGMLADTLNLSEKQTQRLLKKHFNTTFKRKLMDTRVAVAKDLLHSTHYSLERIASDIGYASTQYFCHLFLQSTGMTPSAYRASSGSPPEQSL